MSVKIVGDIRKVKVNKFIGLYNPSLKEWALGKVEVSEADYISIHERTDRPGIPRSWTFDRNGRLTFVSSLNRDWFAAYLLDIPFHWRNLRSTKETLDLIADAYHAAIL